MASIIACGGKFRASICVNRKRYTKVFRLKEEAERWAAAKESGLRSEADKRRTTHSEVLSKMLSPRLLAALEKTAYTHSEIVSAAIPCSPPSGIYFLIFSGEVVYVGQSVDIFARIGSHLRECRVRPWFDSFSYMLADKSRLDDLEEWYSAALVPKFNKFIGPTRRRGKIPTTSYTKGQNVIGKDAAVVG